MTNNIKIFITDCDGVLTDGGMYYFDNNVEAKKFNTKDGIAFKKLKENGLKIGIITGENTPIVENRANKLKMDFIYMGVENKEKLISEICNKYDVTSEQIMYVGDDINDINIMKKVGYSCCPNDASFEVKNICKYICNAKGGNGVIREIADNLFEEKIQTNNYLLNLFNIPNVIVKVPTIWFLKNCMINEEILYNAHLIVRYKTIQAFYENEINWWNIYNKMQRIRVNQNKIIPRCKANNEEAFKKLIDSFQKNGFDEKYPIIVNNKFRLVDGSHRLAAALYFKISYVYIKITEDTFNMDPEYSLKWFEDNGFEDIVDIIKKTYLDILNEWR